MVNSQVKEVKNLANTNTEVESLAGKLETEEILLREYNDKNSYFIDDQEEFEVDCTLKLILKTIEDGKTIEKVLTEKECMQGEKIKLTIDPFFGIRSKKIKVKIYCTVIKNKSN